MKQQCPMANIYLTWAAFVGGLVFFLLGRKYTLGLIWLVLVPLVQWAYICAFPAISRYIGYGSVADQQAQVKAHTQANVTIYTALGCPFCPVMKRRLVGLQREMGFSLEEVDVTFKPELLMTKGIRAVPVIEIGEERLVGHATSKQLADFIGNSILSTTGTP